MRSFKTMTAMLGLGLSLSLSACGFTPVHAPANGGEIRFADIGLDIIEPEAPEDKESAFLLNQRLRDRLGTNTGAYILRATPRIRQTRLGISGDDVATRYDITLSVDYTILDAKSGDVLDRNSVNAISTFGAPNDPYGRISAEKDALRNIAAEAADRLIVKLAGFMARQDRIKKKANAQGLN